MQVIGAGFGRTGTLSLQKALVTLGFAPCHHMAEVVADPDQIPRWRKALAADPVDVRTAFEGYRAAVDFPSAFFWRELREAWPEAKVVLTTRDPHRWYASARDTIFAAQQQLLPPPEVTDPDTIETLGFLSETLVPHLMDIGGGRRLDEVSEEEAIEVFERHIEEVREGVPADQLLVYQVSEGWGPLCDFLGVPVPEEEFPHLNETADFGKLPALVMAERKRRLAERAHG